MLDVIMLGFGFAGGLIYLGGYFCLTRGWITGTSYMFHGTSICSCLMVASSSAHSEAWPSAIINVVFIFMGGVFIARKALNDQRHCPIAVVDAADMTFNVKSSDLTVAA